MVWRTDTPPFGYLSQEANSGSLLIGRSKRVSKIPRSPNQAKPVCPMTELTHCASGGESFDWICGTVYVQDLSALESSLVASLLVHVRIRWEVHDKISDDLISDPSLAYDGGLRRKEIRFSPVWEWK